MGACVRAYVRVCEYVCVCCSSSASEHTVYPGMRHYENKGYCYKNKGHCYKNKGYCYYCMNVRFTIPFSF